MCDFACCTMAKVNPNGGETYPVGFFISEYAASFAANILAATLVEVDGFSGFGQVEVDCIIVSGNFGPEV